MRKKEERVIMRQKINITDALIEQYVKYYREDIRHLIHPSLMKMEDIGTTFEHQNRTFEIVGMTFGGTLMVRESREEGVFYWECTRQFVQMKLGRFNQEFFKVMGKLQTREIGYPENKYYLAPLNMKPKKEEEEEIVQQNEEQPELVSYQDDNYDEENENID
jgi:hypothetical protein